MLGSMIPKYSSCLVSRVRRLARVSWPFRMKTERKWPRPSEVSSSWTLPAFTWPPWPPWTGATWGPGRGRGMVSTLRNLKVPTLPRHHPRHVPLGFVSSTSMRSPRWSRKASLKYRFQLFLDIVDKSLIPVIRVGGEVHHSHCLAKHWAHSLVHLHKI